MNPYDNCPVKPTKPEPVRDPWAGTPVKNDRSAR